MDSVKISRSYICQQPFQYSNNFLFVVCLLTREKLAKQSTANNYLDGLTLWLWANKSLKHENVFFLNRRYGMQAVLNKFAEKLHVIKVIFILCECLGIHIIILKPSFSSFYSTAIQSGKMLFKTKRNKTKLEFSLRSRCNTPNPLR